MTLPSHDQSRECEILFRMARREASALQDFHDAMGRPLYSYALKSLGCEQDAEEALQDAFGKYWEKADTYNPTLAKPYTWAIMILRGLCLDRIRKRGRSERRIQTWRDTAERTEEGVSPEEDGLDDKELRMMQALASLPKPERKAIEMAVFLELPHTGIAAATGEPLGTVKTRIRRGLLRLRQILKHHD